MPTKQEKIDFLAPAHMMTSWSMDARQFDWPQPGSLQGTSPAARSVSEIWRNILKNISRIKFPDMLT